VPDFRIDKLRELTKASKNILSLNTFAHDARLVADGHKVLFDVFDSGPVNGKMLQLTKHKVFRGLSNIQIMVHPPEAIIRDQQGLLFPLHEGQGVDFVKYPVASVDRLDTSSFKVCTGLEKDKLSVLTFGGQGCSGKARIFLDILLDQEQYHENTTRDIILLGGGGYQTTLQEVRNLLSSGAREETKKVTYNNEMFDSTTFELGKNKKVHVWGKVSQEVMYALSKESDHFIIKPGASTTQEVLQRQAKGVVVYYDATHPWEKGNLKLLCNNGAVVIYDSTPKEYCAELLRQKESVPVSQIYTSAPEAVTVIENFISINEIAKNEPVVPIPNMNMDADASRLDDLIKIGINNAVDRIFSAQNGVLKKDSDRIITLKPNVSKDNLKRYFQTFIENVRIINKENKDLIYEYKNVEKEEIITNLLRDLECLIICSGSNTPTFQNKGLGKPVIIWTGSDAMDASIKDNNGICNFDVPIFNTIFVLWEEIFCHDRSLSKKSYLSKIPDEINMKRFNRHPHVIHLKNLIRGQHAEPKDISRQYFGLEFDDEGVDLAETMAMFVSKIFVRSFAKKDFNNIVYYSNNKINEFENPSLSVNSILWDIELPILRQIAGDNIRFKSVYNGKVKEVPFKNLQLVKNKHHENQLKNRNSYTLGMPGTPEWLLQSSTSPRQIVPMSKIVINPISSDRLSDT
jgi:hypothetical protein